MCCSGARTALTLDLARVDDEGVANLAKAFMDEQVRWGGWGGCLPACCPLACPLLQFSELLRFS